jgi:hypothetical protein
MDRLAKSDPDNARLQRDLAASHGRIGNVQVDQGQLLEALASYQADLAIFEGLAKSDPGNADVQRDLSIAYNLVDNVQMAQDNLL